VTEISREAILAARYPREQTLLATLTSTSAVAGAIERSKVLRSKNAIRARMLSRAVRVSPRTVPSVAASLDRLRSIYGDRPVEAYIFADAEVNAFVSEGRAHTVIGFSSAAIEKLTATELEFVLGHELGHALLNHADINCEAVIGMAGEKHEDLVRGWQRAAEISADRAGLLCAGSLEVGLAALIKTVSGLNVRLDAANINEILQQWDAFADEILQEGTRDTTLSHPFPLLRLRALAIYAQHGNGDATNLETDRMMAYMEPSDDLAPVAPSASGSLPINAIDPYLAQFVFWGALYVTGSDASPSPEAVNQLTLLRPPGLDTHHVLSNASSFAGSAIAKIKEIREARRQKLSAHDTFEILSSVLQISKQHRTHHAFSARLKEVASVFGISPEAIDKMLTKGN